MVTEASSEASSEARPNLQTLLQSFRQKDRMSAQLGNAPNRLSFTAIKYNMPNLALLHTTNKAKTQKSGHLANDVDKMKMYPSFTRVKLYLYLVTSKR